MDQIGEAFRPLLGLPAWQVKRGYGSFVTFEFGHPTIEESRYVTREGYLPDIPVGVELRLATVRGDWHLWIYCCEWSLALMGVELSHGESDDVVMAKALRLLSGQTLTAVTVSSDATTTFTFDPGFTFTTRPAPAGTYNREPVEQWMFYEPSGDVLTLRGDGWYSHQPGSTPREDKAWAPVADPVERPADVAPLHVDHEPRPSPHGSSRPRPGG